jgi:hypothetical protein
MPFTNYFDAAIIGMIFGHSGYTPPTTFYVGLSTASPTQSAGSSGNWNFVEITGGGYVRAQISNTAWTAQTSQPTQGASTGNSAAIMFPASTGAWSAGATIGWFGLFDSSTAGNLLLFNSINPTFTIPGAGYQTVFSAGQISVSGT